MMRKKFRQTESTYSTARIILLTALIEEDEGQYATKRFLCKTRRKNGDYIDFFSGNEIDVIEIRDVERLSKSMGRKRLVPEQLYYHLASLNGDILV